MNTTEIAITSAINYTVQLTYKDFIRRFLNDRYHIGAGQLADKLLSQFGSQVASHVKNSKALFNTISGQFDENTKAQTTVSDEVYEKIDKLVETETGSGTIVLDATGEIITQDEILDFGVDLVVDSVADLPDFDRDKIGEFKAWISGQPLSETIEVLNTGNYDGLNERFNESNN